MAQAKSKLVLSLQSQYSLSQQNYVYGIWVEVVVRGFYVIVTFLGSNCHFFVIYLLLYLIYLLLYFAWSSISICEAVSHVAIYCHKITYYFFLFLINPHPGSSSNYHPYVPEILLLKISETEDYLNHISYLKISR